MKTPANSESGWWVVTYLDGFYKQSGPGLLTSPTFIRKSCMTVRCVHWKEAYSKCINSFRNKDVSYAVCEGQPEQLDGMLGRWQFIGIHSLAPLPESPQDMQVISGIESYTLLPHSHYAHDCCQDYSLTECFDEIRESREHSNPIVDPRNEF
ncbi:hypothetical protein Rhal01_02574 [Rubritalea halochordaticola]|uniref:Uncharacterized protein n=2 Tax=Rubritalea halochordaticola TaxID=714537 RepID=A0ABP9V123_9BACT